MMKGIVWGRTYEVGCHKLDEVINNYKRYGFKVVNQIKNQSNYRVIFDNGDQWRVARASDNSRGCRANLSYVDVQIEEEIIDTIILPCTTAGPWNAVKYYGW